MAAFFDLPIHDFAERVLIDAAVLHGRNQSRNRTLELHVFISGNNLATMRWLQFRGSAQKHDCAAH
jgi:hypothetical protein